MKSSLESTQSGVHQSWNESKETGSVEKSQMERIASSYLNQSPSLISKIEFRLEVIGRSIAQSSYCTFRWHIILGLQGVEISGSHLFVFQVSRIDIDDSIQTINCAFGREKISAVEVNGELVVRRGFLEDPAEIKKKRAMKICEVSQ